MKVGLEVLRDAPHLHQDWGRIGLLCNQASVTRDFTPAWDILWNINPSVLKCFFGPQHGFHSTVQDNMIETMHGKGPYHLPMYSLYSETREPTEQMLADIDTIVIDLQIVGCRVYTYKYTMAACLRAAKRFGKKVVVLDRPNPLGGVVVEGRSLDLEAKSFVGEFAIPLRHGLTAGEAAKLFNQSIGATLAIIEMQHWDPTKLWVQHPYHWVLTSPNLPSPEAVFVYPATVVFEGTNISEGRGTTLPFQFVGAPFLDSKKLKTRVEELYQDKRGVYLREVEFQPTSQKWAGKVCYGIQIHVLDPSQIQTFALGLALLKSCIDVGGASFSWKQPPYEYNDQELPINLILGDLTAEKHCRSYAGDCSSGYWYEGIEAYMERARQILIYPREQSAAVP